MEDGDLFSLDPVPELLKRIRTEWARDFLRTNRCV